MFVYLNSEPGLYTVGYYKPNGEWMPEGDYEDREEAATRCRYLNGGDIGERDPASFEARMIAAVEAIGEILETKSIGVIVRSS